MPVNRVEMNPSDFNTSRSFLEELADNASPQSWDRLARLYSPLLRTWLNRHGVQQADADDMIQDVLMVVVAELGRFRHNERPGAFRAWLKGIVLNRLRNFWRGRERHQGQGGSDMLRRLNELQDPKSELSVVWDREHEQHVLQQLLESIAPHFNEKTQNIFRRLVFDGLPPADVAAEFKISLSGVFSAKSRVLRELRRIGKGLID